MLSTCGASWWLYKHVLWCFTFVFVPCYTECHKYTLFLPSNTRHKTQRATLASNKAINLNMSLATAACRSAYLMSNVVNYTHTHTHTDIYNICMLFAFSATAGNFPKSITFFPATEDAILWHGSKFKLTCEGCGQKVQPNVAKWGECRDRQRKGDRQRERQQNGIKVKIVGQKKISSVCVQVKTIIQTLPAAGWGRRRVWNG